LQSAWLCEEEKKGRFIMKKIVLSMLVLMLAVPAMAAKDVNFIAVDEGAGVVAIYYDANSPPGPLPRAFALDVTVDSGHTLDSLSNLSLDYWVYPGSIDINDAGEVNDVGTPVADPCDLPSDTQPGLGYSGITLEMGSLYVGGANAPDPCALLIKVMVSAGGDCNLTIAGNVGRGKAVLEGAAQAQTNLPITILVAGGPTTFTIAGNVSSDAAPIKDLQGVTITGLPGPPVTDANGDYSAVVNAGFTGSTTPTKTQWSITGKNYTNVQADMLNEDYAATATECYNLAGPDYALWSTTFGKPSCWCYRKQCNGDSDGVPTGPFRVGIPDLTNFQGAYNVVGITSPPGICCDFDHQTTGPFRVGIPDLTTFQTYYNVMDASVPQCADTYINKWTN
jgi:hypothetical protein